MNKPAHVDDFIDYGSMLDSPPRNEAYARWVLNYFRMSAVCQNDFRPFMSAHKLFCQYDGKPYRVTGASRLGDVWLTSNYKQDSGYQHRVNIDECSGWAKNPLDAGLSPLTSEDSK